MKYTKNKVIILLCIVILSSSLMVQASEQTQEQQYETYSWFGKLMYNIKAFFSSDDIIHMGTDSFHHTNVEHLDHVINKNLIPGTDYSCEDNIPSKMRLIGKSGVFHVLWDEINGHSLMTVDAYCKENREAGQIASQFECKGSYSIQDRISKQGIIEKDYKVIFDLTFDENECKPIALDGMNYLDCEVIDSSCSWEYCDGWTCNVG